YYHYYGDNLKVECPTGSGNYLNLKQVAQEIGGRLTRLFLPDQSGQRPTNRARARFENDPYWKDLVLFHEYFHAETGQGLGASHQTGWTALVTRLIKDLGRGR
ncbi:MAG TPA: glucosidase, partial [Verrucomicrobiae bacterium]